MFQANYSRNLLEELHNHSTRSIRFNIFPHSLLREPVSPLAAQLGTDRIRSIQFERIRVLNPQPPSITRRVLLRYAGFEPRPSIRNSNQPGNPSKVQ